MRQKPLTRRTASKKTIKDIRRATRKQYSAEEKIRIVLDGLRGEASINFADLASLMPMLDMPVGGGVMENVRLAVDLLKPVPK